MANNPTFHSQKLETVHFMKLSSRPTYRAPDHHFPLQPKGFRRFNSPYLSSQADDIEDLWHKCGQGLYFDHKKTSRKSEMTDFFYSNFSFSISSKLIFCLENPPFRCSRQMDHIQSFKMSINTMGVLHCMHQLQPILEASSEEILPRNLIFEGSQLRTR